MVKSQGPALPDRAAAPKGTAEVRSPTRSVIDVGSIIADTYRIEALIGRGGMGAVFLASHARLPGKKVAIKLLHAELHDPEILARFRREAEIASRLGHPNIVAVHDFNVTPDDTPYLVLEYLEGETLAHRLAAGPLSLDQALSIVRQTGSALAAAHREGIVHRDLKPQNIFLIPTEVDGRIVEIAKVLDFGISKIRGSQTVKTQDSALLGTPQYMAPEQATGKHDLVDERTDVFALGAIVYEMLSGRPAFTGASIPEVVFKVVYEQPPALDAGLPPAIVAAIQRAMAKPSDERFPTVSAFVEALTGQPLASFRLSMNAPPEVGFATGSKRIHDTSEEALAHTVGSGDFGGVVPASVPTAPSPPPPLTDAAALDATVAPSSLVAAPVPAPMPAPAPAPTPRSRTPLLLLGGALACIGATAIIMYLAMRSDPPAGGEQPSSRATIAAPADAPRAAVVTPDAASAAPEADAGTADTTTTADATDATDATGATDTTDTTTTAGGTADTARPDREPATPKPATADERDTAGDASADTGGDERARELLRDAERAFQGGDYELAKRLAKMVGNTDAVPRQRAAASTLLGMMACIVDRDTEQAVIQLRQLGGHRALRRRLLRACSEAGMLQGHR